MVGSLVWVGVLCGGMSVVGASVFGVTGGSVWELKKGVMCGVVYLGRGGLRVDLHSVSSFLVRVLSSLDCREVMRSSCSVVNCGLSVSCILSSNCSSASIFSFSVASSGCNICACVVAISFLVVSNNVYSHSSCVSAVQSTICGVMYIWKPCGITLCCIADERKVK